jgi:hypothetical protein
VNTGAPWPDLDEAGWRILNMQTKLHQWATDDPHRRFDDLFNLVADPAFLRWRGIGCGVIGGPGRQEWRGEASLHRVWHREVPYRATR